MALLFFPKPRLQKQFSLNPRSLPTQLIIEGRLKGVHLIRQILNTFIISVLPLLKSRRRCLVQVDVLIMLLRNGLFLTLRSDSILLLLAIVFCRIVTLPILNTAQLFPRTAAANSLNPGVI